MESEKRWEYRGLRAVTLFEQLADRVVEPTDVEGLYGLRRAA